MLEQSYKISSPSPLFSIDLLEGYNEISSNDEFGHTSNDNTSNIYSEDFEENQESDCETFEQDKAIDNLEHTKFTPCVVIDFIKGKIQRCGESMKLRQLRNLFGTWQVDRDAIKEVDGILSRLEVCDSHF